jgi:hypothetical protein
MHSHGTRLWVLGITSHIIVSSIYMTHWTAKVIGGYLDLENKIFCALYVLFMLNAFTWLSWFGKQDFLRFICSLYAKCIHMIPNRFTYIDYTIYPWTKILLVIGVSHGMPSASPFDLFAEHTLPLYEIFKYMISWWIWNCHCLHLRWCCVLK